MLAMGRSAGLRFLRTFGTSMEDALRECLKEDVKPFGRGGGGCINQGQGYETKSFGRIFVKVNRKKGSETMFRGEMASLKAMYETETVRVPKPIDVLNLGAHGWALVTEYIDMDGGSRGDLVELGTLLARMHKYNEDRLNESS
ncbi:Ketosamine-3-kinase, partial [Trichostrongylus colubriformis]